VGAVAQGARGGPGAAPWHGGKSWNHDAHDDSGAALSQEAGAGAMGHVPAP
jgi:hypothetical protein